MKKTVRFMMVTFFAALLLTVGSGGLLATTLTPYFSVSATALNTNTTNLSALPSDAITWYQKGGIYYLFLPSTTDRSAIRVWFNADKITIDGKTVLNNTITDALGQTGDHTIIDNGSHYILRVMQSDNIPALFLTTSSGTLASIDASEDHSVAETGTMLLTKENGDVAYDGTLTQVKGRGNATWYYPKKPYQIKLDTKTDLLGMGKAKTWLLLANYYDKSLIRNAVTFDMEQSIGLAASTNYAFVDLYANHQYLGNYLLCEKVEIGTNRIEINDLEKATENANSAALETYSRGGDTTSNAAGTYKYYNIPNNPSDITGGYLLEFEYAGRYLDEACGFVTNHDITVVIKSPEYASKAQVEYIRDYVQATEDALYSTTGYNNAGKHYSEYIDVDSAALRYLLEEWCKNPDGGFSSFYLYKDSDLSNDHKIHFDAGWDYDTSYGIVTNDRLSGATKWWVKSVRWFKPLLADASFVAKVEEVYQTTFLPASDALVASLDDYEALLKSSAAMNYIRWDRSAVVNEDTSADLSGSIDFINQFITTRVAFFKEGFASIPFVDVYVSSWYYSDVKYAYQHSIMSGESSTVFDPDTGLTRAMVVQILANLSGEELTGATSPFLDVTGDAWYSKAVAWAAENKIAAGMTDGNFDPDTYVTREQMAAFFYRYCQYKGIDVAASASLTGYTDAASVSPYAATAMSWAVANGYIQGLTTTELGPQGSATRAQAAAVFSRFYRQGTAN